MQVNDDPLASTGNTVLMTVAALVFLPLAALLYAPLFRPAASTPGDGDPPSVPGVDTGAGSDGVLAGRR